MSNAKIVEDSEEERAIAFDRAIEEARQVARDTLAGNVRKVYDVSLDEVVWIFGHHRFVRLRQTKNGKPFPDDPTPFVMGRDTVPLDEFHAYLKTWYWPQQRSGKGRPTQSGDL